MFNVLLQLLDDGRLTDGQGRTVDFKNVVLIMTSNLPGERHRSWPEFINRIDEIVRFRAAHAGGPGPHRRHQLRHLQERLAERQIDLVVTDAAKALLAREGYDPPSAARP